MKDQNFIRPQSDPPPYPGPPGPSNPGYPAYPGYPTTSQPQLSGAAQPMYVGSPTRIIHGATVVPIVIANTMGPDPAQIVCKSCQQPMITRLETSPSMRTHLFALLLCLVGCWPCACIPYCINSCNNADHYCTNCNAYIGSYVG